MDDIQINKVKYDGSKVEIHYEVTLGSGGKKEYTLKSTTPPGHKFIDAFNELKAHVAEWIEIESDDWADSLNIRGVSFSWTNKIMGSVITATKPLDHSNAPLIINTPHKPEEPYAEGPAADEQAEMCLDPDCAESPWR